MRLPALPLPLPVARAILGARRRVLDLADAAVVRAVDEARALLAGALADDLGAIGAYVAPVEIGASGRIAPGNLREQIRASGVTIGLAVQV